MDRIFRASIVLLLALGLASCAEGRRDRTAVKPRAALPACPAKQPARAMLSFSRAVAPARMVTIAAVGDVLLHDRLQKYAAGHKDGFYTLMEPVADIIRAAHVSFANLEGAAAASIAARGRKVREPTGRYDGRVYTGYPMFNYHPSIGADLKRAGFDVVLTANNHSMDRYAPGVDGTIHTVKAAGLKSTGSKSRADMSRPWHTVTAAKANPGTFNIAWIGCTYGTNDVPDRYGQVLNCYKQRDVLLREVAALKARKDIHAVILAPHWGAEYKHAPNGRQKALARAVLDAGATAVIGTHSHVISPWEKYVTKDGRETFITYSLGNFVSNQNGLPRRSSIILLLGLTPAAGGKLAVAAAGWVPIRMHRPDGAGLRGPMYAEAVDRTKRGKDARAHLLTLLPPGNLHPATTKFWADRACAPSPVS